MISYLSWRWDRLHEANWSGFVLIVIDHICEVGLVIYHPSKDTQLIKNS